MLNSAASSLVIVPMAVLAPEIVTLERPPLTKPPNVTVNVSSASTLLSAVVVIVIVREICPAKKETTCDVTPV